MFGDILQPTHLLFILVIALLVLGPKRLPEAGRALGRGLRDFKNALNTDDLRDQMITTSTPETPTTQAPSAAAEPPAFATEPPAFATEPSPAAAAPPPQEATASAAPREPTATPDRTQ